ncbi:MAG: hypothetical protein IH960_03165 [Chloroflexi bacterium]|nr:hypothetical protein [Chloroflexota bacterium]MCH8229572.1 hypothetical protein [Chloroflexota bacterium]
MTREPGPEVELKSGVPDERVLLQRLTDWPITGIGLHPGGSNYVFVVRLTDPEKYRPENGDEIAPSSSGPGGPDERPIRPDEVDEDASTYGIYKPRAGERPLRDFPEGTLHYRERAAYLVSRELGWPRIPPTVIRDGPHGEGSVQLFIDAAETSGAGDDFFSLRDERLDDFKDIAMFDALVHNADRKGGSCIVSEDGRLWAIDHGLTFNQFARRRTVMFEFNGTRYPDKLLGDVESLILTLESGGELDAELLKLLERSEIDEIVTRAREMIEFGHYPVLDPDANVPWPMV